MGRHHSGPSFRDGNLSFCCSMNTTAEAGLSAPLAMKIRGHIFKRDAERQGKPHARKHCDATVLSIIQLQRQSREHWHAHTSIFCALGAHPHKPSHPHPPQTLTHTVSEPHMLMIIMCCTVCVFTPLFPPYKLTSGIQIKKKNRFY